MLSKKFNLAQKKTLPSLKAKSILAGPNAEDIVIPQPIFQLRVLFLSVISSKVLF